MKADCVYVPIDISSPPTRVQRIVESCRPRLILADSSAIKLLNAVLAEMAKNQRLPNSNNGPDDPVHILFTSGSTGTPKGVVLSHRNVTHLIDWSREYLGIAAPLTGTTKTFQPRDRNYTNPPKYAAKRLRVIMPVRIIVTELFLALSPTAANNPNTICPHPNRVLQSIPHTTEVHDN